MTKHIPAILGLLLLLVLGALIAPRFLDRAAPSGEFIVEARYERFAVGEGAPQYPPQEWTHAAPTIAAQAVNDIPQNIQNALRKGGTNLQFCWYDASRVNTRCFDSELPLIAAAGAGHVRLPMSMDTIEEGTSGRVRADRFAELTRFIDLAKSYGLVTIVDVHNTGLRQCSGCDWTEDYMFGIRDSGLRARHLSLIGNLAALLYAQVDTDWFVLQPANEPIYTGSGQNHKSIWFDYLPSLHQAMRSNCPTCVVFVMANDWQGIDATIYNLGAPSFIDGRTIVDVHFYDPTPLTHCKYPGTADKCVGLTWPGTYSTWRGTQLWDKARLYALLNPLRSYQVNRAIPFIHFSEIGTASALACDVKAAYLGDLTDIMRQYGWGWTNYEWHLNFGMKQCPDVVARVFGQNASLPTNTPTLAPTSTPTLTETTTSTPSPTITDEPTTEVTPEPIIVPTVEVTPEPTVEPRPTGSPLQCELARFELVIGQNAIRFYRIGCVRR